MADYYKYLWSTTWPNLLVLFLIGGFILFGLAWKLINIRRKEPLNIRSFIVLTGKTLFWAGVLSIYVDLLLFSQPDWFAHPGIIQGAVLKKVYDSGSRSYILEVRNSSGVKQLFIDRNLFEQLKLNDQVKLIYLPVRREVVSCEFINNLHSEENNTKIGVQNEMK